MIFFWILMALMVVLLVVEKIVDSTFLRGKVMPAPSPESRQVNANLVEHGQQTRPEATRLRERESDKGDRAE